MPYSYKELLFDITSSNWWVT